MTFIDTLLKDNHYKSVEQLPEWLRSAEIYSKQIRSLRSHLGMTQEQLAKRASQAPRLIRHLEAGDVDPQLSTLAKTAQGLECELVIRFVPKKLISKLLKERAKQKAAKMVQLSKGTAAMEEQQPKNFLIEIQMNELVNKLLQKPSLLWDD